jgi:hypothetical protein
MRRPATVRYTIGARARPHAGHPLNRARDAAKKATEVGKVDKRQQQSGDPENVHVREESNQSQDCDNLELHFLALVRYLLGQRMQSQVQDTETDDGRAKDYGRNDHEHVGLAGRGDECRQMVSSGGVQLLSHIEILSQTERTDTEHRTWPIPKSTHSYEGVFF